LAEPGQLGLRTLAPKQAAGLSLSFLVARVSDRCVTLHFSAGLENQLADRRQDISDLIRLRGKAISAHSFRDARGAFFSQANRNSFVTEPFFAHGLPY